MKNLTLITALLLMHLAATPQNVAINDDGSDPHPSAILDLQASDRGLLIPRILAAERHSIETPAKGLMVYQLDDDPGFYFFDGTAWSPISRQKPEKVSDIDGNTYPVIRIGDLLWTQENLRVTHFSNGEAIPRKDAASEWGQADGPARTSYNGMLEDQPQLFGLLYNEYAATDPRGICPAGWRVPGMDEWQALTESLGDQAGGKMKALHQWEAPNTGATNESHFSALPAGYRDASGPYLMRHYQTHFWGAPGEKQGNNISLSHESAEPSFDQHPANKGFSIRCVR